MKGLEARGNTTLYCYIESLAGFALCGLDILVGIPS